MHNLFSELQRLYFLPDQYWLSQKLKNGGEPAYAVDGPLTPEIIGQSLAGELSVTLNLVSAGSTVRAMLVVFNKASDWPAAARLFQAVQDDLELPAPALSVSGRHGFRLWFSLAEPVSVAQARRFLAGLQRNYLAELPAASRQFRPAIEAGAEEGPALVKLTPALHLATGKWSAFIDPSLGAMFVDEPGLAMAPNMDRQAQILAGLESIQPADFELALERLQEPAVTDTASPPAPGNAENTRPGLNVGSNFSDPQSFLLAVMNDPAASTLERIRAAEALLPKFSPGEQK
ncbi:MAG: hypothetical protein WAV95_19015 [Azonexus sp.]